MKEKREITDIFVTNDIPFWKILDNLIFHILIFTHNKLSSSAPLLLCFISQFVFRPLNFTWSVLSVQGRLKPGLYHLSFKLHWTSHSFTQILSNYTYLFSRVIPVESLLEFLPLFFSDVLLSFLEKKGMEHWKTGFFSKMIFLVEFISTVEINAWVHLQSLFQS